VTPIFSAACSTVIPSGACISCPFILRFTIEFLPINY
jgi:hypothetical protein